MINRPLLLADLQIQLAALESDLLSRSAAPGIEGELRAEWEAARTAARTEMIYERWRGETITQVAAAWLLSTVFLRFCEDNRLVDRPHLAGPGDRLALAEKRHQDFLKLHPHLTDRDWIIAGFEDMSEASPVAAGLFDRTHNPMWRIMPSHDAARDLLVFWRTPGSDGAVIHDFTDPSWDTRFLGDLYQDLSERAKKTYALLQTPEFVEEFILEHTLRPSLEEFGLARLRVIDPVCGSGHFLLGAFKYLLEQWKYQAPTIGPWETVARILSILHGVDKNPFAVSITRFRLIVAAMKSGGVSQLAEVPPLRVIVACGDSLLHDGNSSEASEGLFGVAKPAWQRSEDIGDFADVDLLRSGSYHAVFGNPPYTVPKDRVEAEVYRTLYPACTGAYALTVPFIVRFFDLAVHHEEDEAAGYIGLLCSNSFMKREFGHALIERFMPTVDLTHVIDTSGAFIPGHGTPTVILFGRARRPRNVRVETIVGLRGEPELPADPAQGHVWQSIRAAVAHVMYADSWTQRVDIERSVLHSFPWNLTDATSTEILQKMSSKVRLGDQVARIGYVANTGSDDLFTAPLAAFRRARVEATPLLPVVTGSGVRDWTVVVEAEGALFYWRDHAESDLRIYPRHQRRLWPYRTVLSHRANYSGRSYIEDSRPWYEWHNVTETSKAHPWSIVFPWVSTHNHYAVLRQRCAPLQSAPVIRLPESASDSDVFQLAALLNSSLICFWLKHHSNSKGQPRADQTGTGEPWTLFYEFTATRIAELPLPPGRWSRDRWSIRAEALDNLAQDVMAADPKSFLPSRTSVTSDVLSSERSRWGQARARLISLQEELDWEIYERYGLVDDSQNLTATNLDDVPELSLGERAFEIVLARRMATGDLETQWFIRHGSTPITEIPSHWPQAYRDVVQRRIETIEKRRDIALIERPECKRRWQAEPWEKKERAALRAWLLDRCERRDLWFASTDSGGEEPRPMTVNRLADRLRGDADFVSVARLYAGPDADLAAVIADIVEAEHVPYLAALRYKDTGLRKRQQWERTWELQRQEDAISQRLNIPVPPKYTSADFQKASYWSNRGKLDVSKERFISYPLASPDGDGSLLLGWAGWDHREQAHALMTIIEYRGTRDSWECERLIPLIAGLAEIIPWVRQWHGAVDPAFGVSPADAYAAYLEDQMQHCQVSASDLTAWRPPTPKRGRPRKASPSAN